MSQVPGYTRPVGGGASFPMHVVALMIVFAVGFVLVVIIGITTLQRRSERMVFVDGDDHDDMGAVSFSAGDESGAESLRLRDEESHRRTLMAGHVPCTLMFRELRYTIYSSIKNSSAAQGHETRVFHVAGGILHTLWTFIASCTSSMEPILGPSLASSSSPEASREMDGDGMPLLSGTEDVLSDTSSVHGGPNPRITVLDGVHGFVKPGQVMAIMGGSG